MADHNDQASHAETEAPVPNPAADAASLPAPETAAGPLPASLARLDLLLLTPLLVLTFFVGSFAATNSDVWLQLASGRHIAQGEWSIGVDPFSLATEASPAHPAVYWVQHSWLYALFIYLLYNLVGGAGLVVIKALLLVALAWCLLQIPGGKQARLLSVIYVGLAMLALSPQLMLRPMTVSFLFFGITLFICYRAGALGNVAPKARLLWSLPVLFLLWANIDAWFILGPLTLALLWIGMGLGSLLGIHGALPGKTLGAVLGVGLLACLVNPHHIHVFMLPPELANLIVRVADVPDFIGAGGRALQLVDPEANTLVSPLSQKYWASPLPGGGQNLAGLAYLCLLILGVISFVANSAVTKKPGAPGLHPGRFMLWVVLAFLSLLQVRLIPWFAIASAPLTLLNLRDWRTWLTNIQVPSWRPALLGRVLALLVAIVLLFLAWPGWLHAPLGDFTAVRRVAWKMPVDPSYHDAALYLAEQRQAGRELRVFNFSPELAHYCAWFAPDVKCFLDSRWPLFADEAAEYTRARRALSAKLPEVWQKTMLDHKIGYVAVANFQSERDGDLAVQFWQDDTHWQQKYGDGRTVVFAWSGPGKTFAGELRNELRRRAFGEVPEDQRAPAQAPAWPTEEPPFWSEYADGLQPLPLAAAETLTWLRYHQTMATSWLGPFKATTQVIRWAEPAGLGFLSVTLAYALETMISIPTKVYSTMRYRSNNNLLLKARDFGPPAPLLLAIRCIRRALTENPDDPRLYRILAETCKELSHQEDHWTNYEGDPRRAGGMRSTLRQIQITTALKTYLDLRTDDPQAHEQLGNIYFQMKFFDAGLEQLQQVARDFDRFRPNTIDPQRIEAFKKKKEDLEKDVQNLDAELKKRREQYALEAASKKGMEKYSLALSRGLAQEAVNALATMKMDGLSPADKAEHDVRLIQLLLLMGRANELKGSEINPDLARFRVFHAAALGDYATADQVLADMIKSVRDDRARALPEALVVHALAFANPGQAALEPMALYANALTYQARIFATLQLLTQPEAELLTLRGVLALEWGVTAAARDHLEGALRVAGPRTNFQDRVIAERYVELLRTGDK